MNATLVRSTSTDERILRAFLQLVNERGIDGTTTRAVAQAAGVNEVTLFRLFGDKATLAAEAFRRFAPLRELHEHQPQIDTSSRESVVAGIFGVLDFLRARMLEHPELVQFNLAEYWRLPEVQSQLAALPLAGHQLVERALQAAAPRLRPGLDRRAASLSLIGLVLVSVIWPQRGWIALSDAEWDAAAAQAIRCLLR